MLLLCISLNSGLRAYPHFLKPGLSRTIQNPPSPPHPLIKHTRTHTHPAPPLPSMNSMIQADFHLPLLRRAVSSKSREASSTTSKTQRKQTVGRRSWLHALCWCWQLGQQPRSAITYFQPPSAALRYVQTNPVCISINTENVQCNDELRADAWQLIDVSLVYDSCAWL